MCLYVLITLPELNNNDPQAHKPSLPLLPNPQTPETQPPRPPTRALLPPQLTLSTLLVPPHLYIYHSASNRQHEDRVYEERLYGRNCNIVGLTPDSEDSASYIRTVCLALNPDMVILGGFNNSRLLSDRIARTVKQKRQVRNFDSITDPTKLFCKSLVTPIITKLLQQDPNLYIDDETQVVYTFDHKNKHIEASNYLTIFNRLITQDLAMVSFGMPSDYVVFQGVMIGCEIGEMRQCFQRVLEVTRENRDKAGISRPSKNFYPDRILQQMRYNAVFQPILWKKQLTFTTALLNKSVSACERVLLFVQNQFVHQVAQNVHKTTIDPRTVYRAGLSASEFIKNASSSSETGSKLAQYLNEQNRESSIDELIEKMVILNFLKNNTLEKQLLKQDQNIFAKTVFFPLFDKMPISQLTKRYRKIRSIYTQKIGSIMQQRIKNIFDHKENQKNFYTLTQMIKTQEQRNLDFPAQFKVINKQTITQQNKDIEQISEQMRNMIKYQLSASDKKLIEQFKDGNVNRESVVLMQKLLVQAKLRLKKTDIKLPVHHFGAMSGIFKHQMSNRFLNRGKTPKKQLLNIIQQLKQEGTLKQAMDDELQKLIDQGAPRISLDLDQNGEVSFHEDNQLASEVVKQVNAEGKGKGRNQLTREMMELNAKYGDNQDEVYEEFYDDEDDEEAKKNRKIGRTRK